MTQQLQDVSHQLARAKSQLKRDDTLKALDSILMGLDVFPSRTGGGKRFELEVALTECVRELNRQPLVRKLFETLAHNKKTALHYTPGEEGKLKALLTLVKKALLEAESSRQDGEQSKRLERKQQLQERGTKALQEGDLPRGKAALRILGEEYGDEEGVLLWAAERLMHHEIYFEAVEMLEQCIESFPKESKAYALAAQCYQTLREMEKCEAVYLRAIKQFGKHPKTLLSLAKLYLAWNKKEEAFRMAQEAWSKDSTLTEAKEIVDKYA